MPGKVKKYALMLGRSAMILWLLYWCLQASIEYFNYARSLWNPNGLNTDAASMWEERLALLKADLPKEGVIGYVSEMDYPGVPFGAGDQDEEFALSQYTLAPLILDRGNTHHELVVGNFSEVYDYQFEKDLGLRLIFDYGYGIFLFAGDVP